MFIAYNINMITLYIITEIGLALIIIGIVLHDKDESGVGETK